MAIELSSEALLELPGLAPDLGLGLDQRLHREEIDLHGGRVVHRCPYDRRREVVGRDDYGREAHRAEEALRVTRREVVARLLEDRAARRHDHEIANGVSSGEELTRS